MSSSVSATLGLELHACRWQVALTLAALCACALVPWSLQGMSSSARLAASVLGMIVCGWGFVRRGWWPTRASIGRIVGSAEEWCLKDRSGRALHTRLHGGTRFFRHFIWLRFASQHCLLLGPGDLPPDQFRRLQVMLRMQSRARVREHVA